MCHIKTIPQENKKRMRTTLLLAVICLSFLIHPNSIVAQDAIPTVTFEQGKLIGDLPYGRHFYIVGNTKLPKGEKASAVQVEIWKTGGVKYFKKQKINKLDPSAKAVVMADKSKLVTNSKWEAYRADDVDNFKIYVDIPLQFRTEYLIRVTSFKDITVELTDEQKDAIIDRVEKRAKNLFNTKNEVTQEDIKKLVNEETTNELNAEGSGLASRSEYIPALSPSALEAVSNAYGKLVSATKSRNLMAKELAQAREEGDEMVIEDLESSLKDAKKRVNASQNNISNSFKILKDSRIAVETTEFYDDTNTTSVTELQNINIGTSFGAAAVALNWPNKDQRQYDMFGYTGLKFFFSPVDKRVVNPYLENKFLINRLALILGFSTGSNFNYKGNDLIKAIGFNPLVGFSYDFNRYFSVDFGTTFFKQESLSPLSTNTKLRVAPVFGLNLDIDMFNRVSSLITSDKYQIKPSTN